MWLTTSSVGRKVIMSVTGIALVLFLTFHACMNVVVLFSGDAYNMICEFLGSNWYAVAGTAVLVGLIALHFIYAAILTLQNLKARGNSRYAVVETPAKVEWASQNMFVLGLIVCLGLLLHLFNFWANMMGAEFYNGGMALVGEYKATDGAGLIQFTFGNPVYAVLYLVWLASLWFHLSHGFWSAIQTLGVNNKVWFNRWKLIGNVYVTLVMLMFAAVVVYFALGCKPICG
ncbi:hypothetical protein HMPREF9332_01462 [Alloprevotella rava F0323]|uniref:B558 family succinate dehydrogenase cytochrome b subunit n=1 Tax=Alloprevotella rava F0323 TaxID=679199 RepID=G5GD11_9BACT|nr:succinate dehydrogenase/fumarate reductase cytochrome b subunit [Alloprevotella rava]EHG22452.1 hypothetical protein HMPREF9332_01462 [Alloprevotella rava F0323]